MEIFLLCCYWTPDYFLSACNLASLQLKKSPKVRSQPCWSTACSLHTLFRMAVKSQTANPEHHHCTNRLSSAQGFWVICTSPRFFCLQKCSPKVQKTAQAEPCHGSWGSNKAWCSLEHHAGLSGGGSKAWHQEPWRLRSMHAARGPNLMEGSQQTAGTADIWETTATRFARAHLLVPLTLQFVCCQPDN